MKYTKKPPVIEAWELKFNTDCINDLISLIGPNARRGLDGSILIKTNKGEIRACTGDYIVEGENGDFHVKKAFIFLTTHDIVEK